MALILADRVKETTLTTNTGPVTLLGPAVGFQSFSSTIGDGNSTYYTIAGGVEWEVGVGTYNSSGNTLTRDSVLSSSNSGSPVSFSAGAKDVFVTLPAEVTFSTYNGTTPLALQYGGTGADNFAFPRTYGVISLNSDGTGFLNNTDFVYRSNKLGIGTSSPTVKLDIGGSTALAIQASLTSGTIDSNFHLYAVNGANSNAVGAEVARFGVGYNGNASTSFSSGFSFIRGGNTTDGSLAILTNASERMRIDSSGNVGIGTTTNPSNFRLYTDANGISSVGPANEEVCMYAYSGGAYMGTWSNTPLGIGVQGDSYLNIAATTGIISHTYTIKPNVNETATFSSWNSYTHEMSSITNQSGAITIGADSGIANVFNGQKYIWRIKASTSGCSVTFDSSYFKGIGVTLPSARAVGSGETLMVGAIYNTNSTRWEVVALTQG